MKSQECYSSGSGSVYIPDQLGMKDFHKLRGREGLLRTQVWIGFN